MLQPDVWLIVSQAHQTTEDAGHRAIAEAGRNRLAQRPGQAQLAGQNLAHSGGARRHPPVVALIPEQAALARQPAIPGVGIGVRRRRTGMRRVGVEQRGRHGLFLGSFLTGAAPFDELLRAICPTHNISNYDQFFAWKWPTRWTANRFSPSSPSTRLRASPRRRMFSAARNPP